MREDQEQNILDEHMSLQYLHALPIQRQRLLVFFVLLAVSFGLYANALPNGFVLDDYDLIVRNAYIKHPKFFSSLFTTDIYRFSTERTSNYYRPLQTVTYAIEYAIYKLHPTGYHVTNVLLHAITSYLVWWFILLLFGQRRLALISSLLFCICPLHTSAVAYIAGRADILASLFMLMSLVAFLNASRSWSVKSYAISLLGFAGALLSRENSLLFPAVVALSCFAAGMKARKVLLPMSGLLLVEVGYLINRVAVMGKAVTSWLTVVPPSWGFSLINAVHVLEKYIVLFFTPWPLYLRGATPFVTRLTVLESAFLITGLVAILLVLAKDRTRVLSFGLLWFLVALSPLVQLIYYYPSLGAAMAENWLYFPSIGALLVVGRLLGYGRIRLVILAGLVGLYSVLTIVHNLKWKDEGTFYRHVVTVSPHDTFAHLNLASYYTEQGRYDEAIQALKVVLEEAPQWDVWFQLGRIHQAQGDMSKAQEFYHQSILLNPKAAASFHQLGIIYDMGGEEEQALRAFMKALESNPDLWQSWIYLGNIWLRRGADEKALAMYQKALELHPEDPGAYIVIGRALGHLGHREEARAAFQQALALDPRSVEALIYLGAAYGNLAQFDRAMRVWKRALRIDPHNEEIPRYIRETMIMQAIETLRRSRDSRNPL